MRPLSLYLKENNYAVFDVMERQVNVLKEFVSDTETDKVGTVTSASFLSVTQSQLVKQLKM